MKSPISSHNKGINSAMFKLRKNAFETLINLFIVFFQANLRLVSSLLRASSSILMIPPLKIVNSNAESSKDLQALLKIVGSFAS